MTAADLLDSVQIVTQTMAVITVTIMITSAQE
jgi:hypothetical protein